MAVSTPSIWSKIGPGALDAFASSTRAAPRLADLGQPVQRVLQQGGPLGQHVQPGRRQELPPLPRLLLRLEHVQRRLVAQDPGAIGKVEVDLRAELGEVPPDRLDLGAGRQRTGQGTKQIRHPSGLCRDLGQRDCRRGGLHRLSRRRGRLRRLGAHLAGERRDEQGEHREQRPDDTGRRTGPPARVRRPSAQTRRPSVRLDRETAFSAGAMSWPSGGSPGARRAAPTGRAVRAGHSRCPGRPPRRSGRLWTTAPPRWRSSRRRSSPGPRTACGRAETSGRRATPAAWAP